MSNTVIAVPTKSVGISLILTFLFGALGMFYSTVKGAIIMLVIEILAILFTLGLGLLITRPIAMIWGYIATKKYNEKLLSGTITADTINS